jgi:hypothetical protein
VIFPEGTTSNGSMLLKFLPCLTPLTSVKPLPKFHLVSFRVDERSVFVMGNPLLHLFRILCVPNHTMQVSYCLSSEVPAPSSTLVPDVSAGMLTAADGQQSWAEEIAKALGLLSRVMRSTFGAKEKLEFVAYYNEKEHGKPKKATKKNE